MASAEVGDDDRRRSDPRSPRTHHCRTVGKRSRHLMPSGTMTNQIALRLHCQPGDEFLCEAGCHIYNMEQGAFASLSGLVGRPLQGEGGILKLADFQGQIHANNDHLTRTRLICIENTHNRGAGAIQPWEEVAAICDWAHQHHLMTHLDGARLFNASVATGRPLDQWCDRFDTVSVCFSKGLGAPVGSALAAPVRRSSGHGDIERLWWRYASSRCNCRGRLVCPGTPPASAARRSRKGPTTSTGNPRLSRADTPSRSDRYHMVIVQIDRSAGTAQGLVDAWPNSRCSSTPSPPNWSGQ